MENKEIKLEKAINKFLDYESSSDSLRDYMINTLLFDEELADGLTKDVVNAREQLNDAARSAKRNMMLGLLWFVGGSVVTAVTYSATRNGGTYVLCWGAIVFGLLQFIGGAFTKHRIAKLRNQLVNMWKESVK